MEILNPLMKKPAGNNLYNNYRVLSKNFNFRKPSMKGKMTKEESEK